MVQWQIWMTLIGAYEAVGAGQCTGVHGQIWKHTETWTQLTLVTHFLSWKHRDASCGAGNKDALQDTSWHIIACTLHLADTQLQIRSLFTYSVCVREMNQSQEGVKEKFKKSELNLSVVCQELPSSVAFYTLTHHHASCVYFILLTCRAIAQNTFSLCFCLFSTILRQSSPQSQ